ncbi:hypothetical protein [Aeromicrobium sp. CF3.5]|uniref:hypothetical protein n=1 Tax=Aeromicrobium sp. CF3.5 TaxID=3373078 RepID=UPI003EE4A5D6
MNATETLSFLALMALAISLSVLLEKFIVRRRLFGAEPGDGGAVAPRFRLIVLIFSVAICVPYYYVFGGK